MLRLIFCKVNKLNCLKHSTLEVPLFLFSCRKKITLFEAKWRQNQTSRGLVLNSITFKSDTSKVMLHPLLIVVALALGYWFIHIKKKGTFRRHKAPRRVITQVEGFEVRAYLSAATPAACLCDDGIRFGRSFRLKEGPSLPHSDECLCEVAPISLRSNDVFDGALCNTSSRKTAIGTLPLKESDTFKKAFSY